ncbi:MAG: InlB B-repeat-containing protein, partial [Firmicutes bacterium]|nr:InlB B-repeat-containing protein [Bacillota bacterium]
MIKNRVLKKSSIFLLAIILIASTLFVGVHFGFNRGETLSVEAQTIARVPMRGSGTVDDPFLISTVGELHSVRYYGVGDAARGRVFRMENDIDLMSVPNWQPIGTIPTNLVPNQPDNNMVFGVLQFNQTPWNGFAANHQIHQIRHTSFQGHFDGNGFSVRNMAINRPNENFLGLFGAAYYATIRNLGVAHGGGWNEQWQPQGGRGHVIGRDFVGGIVGYMFRSTVSHSWNTVEVGNQMLFDPGGIAGVADHHSHIRNSWNGGPINGEMVGGIVGAIRAGSRIENVYNTGIVTVLTNDTWGVGSQRRLRGGGITGWLRSSAISHAYNHSQIDVRRDIRHTEVAVGGLVGRVDDHGHSAFGAGLFYNRDLVGQHVQWGVYGPTPRENASARSNAQMYQQSTFQGFDFNNVWYMVDGEHTPRLRGVGGQLHDIEFMPNGGTGHMPNQRVVSGRTVALNQNAFARSGYIFAGWSNHPQGAVLHPNQGLFTHVPGQRARLYAQWTTAIRTLQFNGGGGVGAMPSIQIGGGMRIVLPQNTFTRAGHEFVEWFNPLTGNTYADGETFTMPMADTVLYARWTASLQTISFIGNGG